MSDPGAIETVRGRRVWDSRGHPTVEVEVRCAGGATGRAIAPAGASRGTREAVDLRDGGTRLKGLDVRGAVDNVNARIAPALVGLDATDQATLDAAVLALDSGPMKDSLGGNAAVATSLAGLHAGAAVRDLPLWAHVAALYGTTPSVPLPEIQIFGGGAHAGRRVDVQDFMIVVPGAGSIDEALEITAEVYHAAGALMTRRGGSAGVADEGGWWPAFGSNEEALETLVEAIVRVGETPGERVAVSLDIAASEFRGADGYRLGLEDRTLDADAMIELLGRWIDDYAIVSIEDPLAEDDVAGMRAFTAAHGHRVQVVGDDYLVTNADLVAEAARSGACNCALIKPNQAGTVSEAVAAFEAARAAGWGAIVSARSGETEDVSVAHLAAGLGAGQLKVGSFARTERTAKWNECLRIAEALGDDAFAAGRPLAATRWGSRRTGLAPATGGS